MIRRTRKSRCTRSSRRRFLVRSGRCRRRGLRGRGQLCELHLVQCVGSQASRKDPGWRANASASWFSLAGVSALSLSRAEFRVRGPPSRRGSLCPTACRRSTWSAKKSMQVGVDEAHQGAVWKRDAARVREPAWHHGLDHDGCSHARSRRLSQSSCLKLRKRRRPAE